MFTRAKKGIAVSLALVFAVGLAAYAQVQPNQRLNRQKPQIAGQARQRQGDAQHWRGGTPDPAHRQETFFQNVCLERLLMPPPLHELERLAFALNLTEEQKQQIKALYEQFRNIVRPIREERGEAVKEVLRIMQEPSPSKGALQSAANKVQQADEAILDAEFDFWLALKGILNPQQQGQISQYLQRKALGRFGHGGPDGPPAPAP